MKVKRIAVVGGRHRYVSRMLEEIGPTNMFRDRVRGIERGPHRVAVILASGDTRFFDDAVLATHADQALRPLRDPLPQERTLLSAFHYQPNATYRHSDDQLMPVSRRTWCSWDYRSHAEAAAEDRGVCVTYWVNRLQGLAAQRNYCVSLNPLRPPRKQHLIARMAYEHPVFKQKASDSIQGAGHLWYRGSCCGYGFQEDAPTSSVRLAAGFGVRAPWESAAPAPVTLSQPAWSRPPSVAGAAG